MDVERACTYIAFNSEGESIGLLRKMFPISEKDFLQVEGFRDTLLFMEVSLIKIG
jgi:hypothetical protein